MQPIRRGMRSHPRRRIAGFSLIELLIVISIIVLLIGIAIPALRFAQRTARTNVCQSNLSGIGQAINQWLEDRNQTYPGLTFEGNPVDLYNWGGKTGAEAISGSGIPAEERPLFHYSGVSGFECPMDRGSTLHGTDDVPAHEKFGTSYTAGNRPGTDPTAGPAGDDGWWYVEGHRSSQIEVPGKKLVMADVVFYTGHSASDYVNQWHGSSSPMTAVGVFADGHVELLRRDNSGPANPADVDAANAWANDDRPYY